MSVKCPYCQQEMEKGYIYNGKEDTVWTPENSKQSYLINFPHENQIMLSKRKFLSFNKIKVYRCPLCKIQVIFENDLTD